MRMWHLASSLLLVACSTGNADVADANSGLADVTSGLVLCADEVSFGGACAAEGAFCWGKCASWPEGETKWRSSLQCTAGNWREGSELVPCNPDESSAPEGGSTAAPEGGRLVDGAPAADSSVEGAADAALIDASPSDDGG